MKMRLVLYCYISMIVLGVQAWPSAKRTFEQYVTAGSPYSMHTITDCMHVASEPGDYILKKSAPPPPPLPQNFGELTKEAALFELEVAAAASATTVCGLYVIGEPNTIVEITMKHYDVNCETGGLMAFVDGWELNGEYFPGIKDHHRELDDRIYEFCNNNRQWPRITNKKFFRSSQNAALLQYRIADRGSFVANVRFHKITQPCNVLVQDNDAVYKMSNFGQNRNCTISALFPAVISLANLRVGGKKVRAQQKVNYGCDTSADRLEIGGSSGLDSYSMQEASAVCGATNELGPEQAIFCGVTTVRLLSTGRYQNQVSVVIRKADEQDIDIATLSCGP